MYQETKMSEKCKFYKKKIKELGSDTTDSINVQNEAEKSC